MNRNAPKKCKFPKSFFDMVYSDNFVYESNRQKLNMDGMYNMPNYDKNDWFMSINLPFIRYDDPTRKKIHNFKDIENYKRFSEKNNIYTNFTVLSSNTLNLKFFKINN